MASDRWYQSLTTTSPCASRCQTCCGSSVLPLRRSRSAESFLASEAVSETRCLILDIAMSGMSGPDLQQELRRRRQAIPIVFITAQDDDKVRPRLIAEGAVECLFKPFSDIALLDALNAALRVTES